MHAASRIVLGFFAAGLISPAAAAEREIKHQFPVTAGCTLKLDTYRGEITVAESDDPTVQVTIQMEVGGETEADAERVLRALQLEVKETENVVSIFARNPRETRARWVWREDEQIGLFFRITVPRACNVEVKNAKGNVTIGRLRGRMVAEVESGTIFFRGVEGSVQASLDEGDVVISRCTGDVSARVRSGNIRTGLIGGAAELKSGAGSIEVMVARGGVSAGAVAGDVSVGFPRDLQAGAALTSSGGNIIVRLDPAADCVVDASSKWGRVHCAAPLALETGASGKRQLRGRLNAGGPVIALHADGGNVRIETGETPFE